MQCHSFYSLSWLNLLTVYQIEPNEDQITFSIFRNQRVRLQLQAANDAGEFYTPRALTQLIVDRVNPELNEKILDPACGTGGFLVNVIENLRKKATTEDDQKLLQEAFKGIEKKHLPYILCMTKE